MDQSEWFGLRREVVVEKSGIYVDQLIAERTVWDKMAIENPTHAVISAADETAAAEKSRAQIDRLQTTLKSGVVLDLGCGYGRVAQYLLPQRTFTGYIGLDSSYEMLQLFKRRYQTNEAELTTPLGLINANIHTIPLADQSVDNVIVSAVFLHNHKSITSQSLTEIKRVLRPGGLLIVDGSFPNKWSLMGLQGTLYQGLLALMGKRLKNGPVRYYGPAEIKSMLKDFAKVTITPVGFALLPKRLIFLPGLVDAWYRRLVANPINQLLARILPTSWRRCFPTHFDVVAQR